MTVRLFNPMERLNYTALGDNVNLASRLEGVNKRYGTQILISQPTYRYVRNRFVLRPLDIIAVKGKLTSILVYELLGEAESDFRSDPSLDLRRATPLI